MVSSRVAALLLVAGGNAMVATLGFAAPKTSIAVRARQGGFLGEGVWQEEGVIRRQKALLSARRGLDASMRLGVRVKRDERMESNLQNSHS